MTDVGDPIYSAGEAGDPPLVWPPNGSPRLAPTLVTFIDRNASPIDVPVPADPRSSTDFPFADVPIDTNEPITLTIEAENMPLDWSVVVRVVPKSGPDFKVPAILAGGDLLASTWTAQFATATGFSAIQVRGTAP